MFRRPVRACLALVPLLTLAAYAIEPKAVEFGVAVSMLSRLQMLTERKVEITPYQQSDASGSPAQLLLLSSG